MKVTVHYVMNPCESRTRRGDTVRVFPERGGWAAICGSKAVFEALKPYGEVIDGVDGALRFGGDSTQEAIMAVLRQAFDQIEEANTPPWVVVEANLN